MARCPRAIRRDRRYYQRIGQIVYIFANPIAGRGKATIFAEQIQRALITNDYEARLEFNPPAQLAPKALPDLARSRAIIVVGGDGTLRGVARLVLNCCGARPCPPILLIPLGTANLMAKHLGIKWHWPELAHQVLRTLENGNTRSVDAGLVRSSGDGDLEQLLLLMMGVGMDAKIVHELARLRRGPVTYASYAVPAALALSRYRFPVIDVRVDSQTVFSARGIALVGNIAEYGVGFPVLSRAVSDDGLLDICALPCRNAAELVKLFLLTAAGKHLSSKGVVYTTGRNVEITAAAKVELQIDGDPAGFTPASIRLLDQQLTFLVKR